MGRSSARKAIQNRAEIVEIASNMFRNDGVDAVTVADVMAAAGMTVGGFYKHFASKDALVEEAAALAFQQSLAIWTGLPGAADASADRMREALVGYYLRPDPQRRCPLIAFAPHSAGQKEEATFRSIFDKGAGALMRTFADGASAEASEESMELAHPETLTLFAAMIGARVIAEAAGDVPWVRALRKAVIESAGRKHAPDQGTAAD